MVYQVIWSSLALHTYMQNIDYLEKEWTEKEIEKFIDTVLKKITILSLHPRTGKVTNKRANLRQIVINKRIVLIYRCKTLKREIELVRFFNTYQDVKALKK